MKSVSRHEDTYTYLLLLFLLVHICIVLTVLFFFLFFFSLLPPLCTINSPALLLDYLCLQIFFILVFYPFFISNLLFFIDFFFPWLPPSIFFFLSSRSFFFLSCSYLTFLHSFPRLFHYTYFSCRSSCGSVFPFLLFIFSLITLSLSSVFLFLILSFLQHILYSLCQPLLSFLSYFLST